MKQFSERIAIRALISTIIVLFSMISYAATYYISPTGNDTSGNGTITSPWFTLNKAWSTVAAGDVIYMRGGTYAYTSTQLLTGKNGTSASKITITAYPNEKPIVKKGGSFSYRMATAMIYITGSNIFMSNISLTGFRQEDAYLWVALKLVDINNCTFERLSIHGNSSGIYLNGSSNNNIILNCDIYNNHDPLSADPYGNGDGVAFANIPAGNTNTLRGCRIYYNSDDGLDCWNNEGIAIVDNCWVWMNGYREDHVTIGGDGNALKLGLTQTSSGTVMQRDLRNNLLFKNRANAIDQNGGRVLCHVYNNTIWGNVAGVNLWDYSLSHIIRNNAVFGNAKNYSNGDYSNTTRDHNSYDASWQPSGIVTSTSDFLTTDTTGISGPRQANGDLPNLNFLKLASSSKLINAGTNIGIAFSGSAPDLGAFEYGGSTIDATPPVITAFTFPSVYNSLIVPISTFTATDNVGVAGYLLTETGTTPSSSAGGWSSTKPTAYTFSSYGAKTLYAWAKDAAGNVSASFSGKTTISSPIASTFTFTGPSSGNVYSTSANFTVTPNNSYTGTITLTPSGTGSAGLSAKVLTFNNSSAAQTFTITPTVAGNIVLTATNSGGLTNPASLIYSSKAVVPAAPVSVVASAGNKTATVTFVAPSNNGGSAITGYTVTSIPVGGVDTNAGSTSLQHTISGLTNGLSYTFTVKAVNSVGSSVASLPSNPVIPASSSTIEYKAICEGSNYNGWSVTGKYTRTLTTQTGGDSIVTTYLTVNPKYAITENITIALGETYNGWSKSGQYIRTLASVSGCDSTVTTNLTVIDKGSEIATYHFIPVWQGENGQNHMNFIVTSAIVDDIQLTADDEIAVFSGGICVGAQRLLKTITNTDSSTFLSFVASMSDGTNNGFISNDTIIFKIWDNQNQKEVVAKKVTYQKDLSTWLTTGRYSSGATAVVGIESFTEYTQTIDLIKGYNLFSTYVTPVNPDVSAVTKALKDNGKLIKVQDEAGNSYEYLGSFGGWSNKIGNVQKTEGYRIRVSSNSSLQITGRQISLPLDIPLQAGWNFISYPRIDQVDAMSVVQALINENKLIKVLDEQGNSIENWGKNGGWRNNIGNLIPGKGYKINVSSNTVLTIQQSYPKSAVILAGSEETEYFSTKMDGNSSDHMNINIVGLRASGMSVGDELAAFDGPVCVGTLKITENNLSGDAASLIASFSTDEQNQNGFKEGSQIQIRAWSKLAGDESQVMTNVLSGQMTYAKSASVLVNVQSLVTEIPEINELVTVDVFPNPSQGKFTVRFSELPDTGSKIDVLDLSGRKIVSRLIGETTEEFNLNHLAPGLYLVKSTLGTKETIHKLIIK